MNAHYSADISGNVSRTIAGNAINSALRQFVGCGKDYSVKMLSNLSGVPDRLIESAMCHPETGDYRALKPEALLSIAMVLGPAFTTEFLKPIDQAAYRKNVGGPVEPFVLVADCAADTAEVADAARDGRFNVHERKKLAAVGQRHVERGMMLVAMGA